MSSRVSDFSAILLTAIHRSGSRLGDSFESLGNDEAHQVILQILNVFNIWLNPDAIDKQWISYNIARTQIVTQVLVLIAKCLEKMKKSNLKGAEIRSETWTLYLTTVCNFIRFTDANALDYRSAKFSNSVSHKPMLLRLILEFQKHFKVGTFYSVIPSDYILFMYTIFMQGEQHQPIVVDIIVLLIEDCFSLNMNLNMIETKMLLALDVFVDPEIVNSFLSAIRLQLEALKGAQQVEAGKIMLHSINKYAVLVKTQTVDGTVRLIRFSRQNNHPSLARLWLGRLHKSHVMNNNMLEAAISLQTYMEIPDNGLDTAAFGSTEDVYLECIDLYCKSEAWERAIKICGYLLALYISDYDLEGAAQTLRYQAYLYRKIMANMRVFPSFYQVSYYGKGFGKLSGKQFIHRGQSWEPLSTFIDQVCKDHEDSQLIRSVDDIVANSDGKFIHICAVVASPDYRNWPKAAKSSEGLLSLIGMQQSLEPTANPIWLYEPDLYLDDADAISNQSQISLIPVEIAAYYQQNETNAFTFSKPIRKSDPSFEGHPAREFLELYTEKKIIFCEESFPCLSSQSQVKYSLTFQIKPIENAIISVRTKTKQLLALRAHYLKKPISNQRQSLLEPLSKASYESSGSQSLSPFTMALKSAVDSPVNGGIPMYQIAFLGDENISDKSGASNRLRGVLKAAIEEQVIFILNNRLKRSHLVWNFTEI